MVTVTVVLIGETTSAYVSPLQKQYTTYTVRSGKQALVMIRETNPSIVVIDALSLGTTGERICRSVRQTFPEMPMIHIHPGPRDSVNSPANVILVPPINIKNLLNYIHHTTSERQAEWLTSGPFKFDPVRRILFVDGEEYSLTPKIATLMELFLSRPGEILDRKWLMQEVWDTDYTGDTRTLSVHIRFLRELMEEDASQPRYIITVRGVGYRFVSD